MADGKERVMYKFLGKDNQIYLCADRAGAKANEVSSVWNMGLHVFTNSTNTSKTIRLVYWKTKNARYYCQISIDRGIPQTDCGWGEPR